MAIQISPLKNHLRTSQSPYYLHTEWTDTVEYDRLVDIMATGRTTLTKPDITGCLELEKEELAKLLADGRYVKTNIGALYICASGKLDSLDQSFNPGSDGSHVLRLHFRPDKAFEAQVCALVAVERGKLYDRTTPSIFSAVSMKTEADMAASAGDILRIAGQRLKFDKANAAEGLFFINGQETRAVQYASIQPALVIAQVPADLPAGSYVLALRSLQGGKELHEGRATLPFVVQ